MHAGEVGGEQLVAVAHAVGGDQLASFAHRFVDEAALLRGALHAEAVVYEDAHHCVAAACGAVAVGDYGACKGQHKEYDGEDASGKEQPAVQVAATAAFGVQFLQSCHVAEVDRAVAVEVEQVHGDGY